MNEHVTNDFQVDEYGLAMVIRLVEARADKDLQLARHRLQQAEDDLGKLEEKTGVIAGAKRIAATSRIKQMKNSIGHKEEWLERWLKRSWTVWETLFPQVGELSGLKTRRILDVLDTYLEREARPLKTFLILQEAVLTPLYGQLAGYNPPKGMKELDADAGLATMSMFMDLDAQTGAKILRASEDFARGLEARLGKLVKVAASADVSVTIGGGALLGTGKGAGMGAAVFQRTIDDVASDMFKASNYASYLLTSLASDRREARAAAWRVMEAILAFKHSFENELLLEAAELDVSRSGKVLAVLHYTYGTLLELVSATS